MVYLIGILWTITWIWLIVTAFKADQVAWGVAMIIFPPSCYLYGTLNWSKASKPFIVLLIMTALMFTLSPEEVDQLR